MPGDMADTEDDDGSDDILGSEPSQKRRKMLTKGDGTP